MGQSRGIADTPRMTKVALVANTDWYLYNFRLSLADMLRRERFDLVLISPRGPFVAEFARNGFRWREGAGGPWWVRSSAGLGTVSAGPDRRSRLLRPTVRALYRHALGRRRGVTTFENPHDQDYFQAHRPVSHQHTRLIPGAGVDTERFAPTPEPPGAPVVVL